jgi:hypothetical protein
VFGYNKGLSVAIANMYPELFRKNGCYQNVYNLLTEVAEIDLRHVQVLFCYLPGRRQEDFYVRHVFLLYNGEIVEPLLHLALEKRVLSNIVIIKSLSPREYLNLLLVEEVFDLFDSLLEDELKVFYESKISLNPIDLSELIRRTVKTPQEFIENMDMATKRP